ncbi:nucleoside hydrolase [Microbacterium sp. EST19A]|uniref:nucleoside hydrolase n=1 Tax=Microbacterium sp. EST19A TaxID=2862681 RepID=UPI001CC00752|nr:nucleoside hydrolase [Microbacterium sp. EST19A]
MPTPVILDCDPGYDDVFAIWLAAADPSIDLRAITTVAGNGAIEHTSLNARVACTIAGVLDVPIARGAAGPLAQELKTADWIHGSNALGGVELPEPAMALDDRDATELIRDVLRAAEQPVTIAATGPLTNIALVIERHPDLMERIARIVWMGGSTARGNVSAYGEFNASTDPEAVDVVLRSGIPFTMVGLNISHQALITREVRARIRGIGNATGLFGADLLEQFCSTYDAFGDMPDGPLHDPITIALIIDPAVATVRQARIDIELTGEHTRGATVVDLLELAHRPKNATVALELDVKRFWHLVEDAVTALR